MNRVKFLLPDSFTGFDSVAMPRQPKLRKKKVGTASYWYTEAGGPTYFGKVDDVSYLNAKKLFADHTQSLLDEKKDAKLNGFTAGDLLDLFLDWIKKHRSPSTGPQGESTASGSSTSRSAPPKSEACLPTRQQRPIWRHSLAAWRKR